MQAKYIVFLFGLLMSVSSVHGEEAREEFNVEINANIDTVWHAFSTTDGLQSWVAPLADIDLKVGGKWRANYNAEGKLGDESTIVNTILSYDPKHMLVLKATGFPKGFKFVEAAKDTWSVFYFEALSETKTKVTIVGLGYNDSEQSKKMRSFFAVANQYSMEQLRAAVEK
jgi:uncharacterized protein YndB with AHSA1/START domain